jgi:hypothetical protein
VLSGRGWLWGWATLVCLARRGRSGVASENSVFVDAFLYDDDAVDELCDARRLSRCYCPDTTRPKVCLPLNFLSHSMSVAELGFIFSSRCLGDLQGRTVCDVGSRLGPVL